MIRVLKNIPLLTIVGLAITSISLYLDWGSELFTWFQRSGSLLVLIGAIMSYRSIVRLGIRGVGGASSGSGLARVKRTYIDENGFQSAEVEHSPEDVEHMRQKSIDDLAGFAGAVFIIFGTIIWGYGDLLGKI